EGQQQLAVDLVDGCLPARAVRRKRAESEIEERRLRVERIEVVTVRVLAGMNALGEARIAVRHLREPSLHVGLDEILLRLRLMLQLHDHRVRSEEHTSELQSRENL